MNKIFTKICTGCGEELPATLEYFYKGKKNKDGLQYFCKECKAKHGKKYRKNNKEKIAKLGKEYYKNNKAHIKEYCKKNKEYKKEYLKEYYKKNKEELNKQKKGYYKNNKEKMTKQNKEYYEINKEKIVKQRKEYYKSNIEKIIKRQMKYNKNNKEKIAERIRKYQRNRLKIDINYKILCNLRTRILHALKNNSKSASSVELLGCTIEEYKMYLKKQFKTGMSWKNHGSWHIDHIVPCASFDLSNSEQQKICFNYKNLQPLWAQENLKKGSRVL